MKYVVTSKEVELQGSKIPALVRVGRDDGESVKELLKLDGFSSEGPYTKTRLIPKSLMPAKYERAKSKEE